MRALDGNARGVTGPPAELECLAAQAVGVVEEDHRLVAKIGETQTATPGQAVAAGQREQEFVLEERPEMQRRRGFHRRTDDDGVGLAAQQSRDQELGRTFADLEDKIGILPAAAGEEARQEIGGHGGNDAEPNASGDAL